MYKRQLKYPLGSAGRHPLTSLVLSSKLNSNQVPFGDTSTGTTVEPTKEATVEDSATPLSTANAGLVNPTAKIKAKVPAKSFCVFKVKNSDC